MLDILYKDPLSNCKPAPRWYKRTFVQHPQAPSQIIGLLPISVVKFASVQ